MNISMSVHSCAMGKVARKAKLDGTDEPVTAMVDGCAVQLTSAEGHGTLALNFTGDAAKEAEKQFVEGADVEVELTVQKKRKSKK